MNTVIESVRKELRRNAVDAVRDGVRRFFKERVKLHGVKTPVVRALAARTARQLRGVEKERLFALCEKLLRSNYMEEALIAFEWADGRRKEFVRGDFKRFERWVKTYVDNWAKCDTFCNHTVGSFVERYPEFIGKLREWTRSPNRWVRRAAAVTLILPARHGKFLSESLEIAGRLLPDEDDLVRKGTGWLLKAAAEKHAREVFNYVLRNKKKMPRTVLRYAIEKMPAALRRRAMA
ncbi:MAG TPA: DNA alkylation repair protein [Elusimicrobiota bacterium]|nr:DNA alkylation repair protein [Elusimicrobiota bacterium]